MTTRNLLLTPGPSPVPPEVLEALARPIFHHRTPQYQKLFKGISEDLKQVFRTRFPVYTLTGSGTLAMEASVTNFCSPGDKVIVIEAGKFGERWRHIAECFGLKVVPLRAAYGEVVAPEKVEEALKEHPDTKCVYGTLCETSTGVLFDIEKIGRIVSNTPAVFVVDAISGLAADRFEMDAWKVDVTVSGSQKGLMLPPGLAFMAVSDKAKKLNESAKLPRFYAKLEALEKALQDADTPYTPAISLVVGLRVVLDRLKQEGIENVWQRTARLAEHTRQKAKKNGFDLFCRVPSNTVTALKVPAGVDGAKLVSIMRDKKGVTLAGGQGEMKGKIVRIAHFGCITEADLGAGFSVLIETVSELKENIFSKANP